MLVMQGIAGIISSALTRPRPYGVTIIGKWGGFSMPALPVAMLTAILVGMAYTLVVAGRPRWYAKIGIAAIVVVLGFAREYLAVEHPSDLLYAVVLGVAVPVTLFRLIVPNEIFPVRYKRGRSAHLDVTGRRGVAIRQAVQKQLGLTVLEIKPVGLEGSGGSTPLRLTVQGDPDEHLFAKLYARSHVRSDRWYKVWRTIRSGALEDEASFQTVRRFVEYEDYTLRLMQDVGIKVPAPFGIVEITPEREYMIVMEFFEGAVEIGEAEVDDEIIDQGLRLIRDLWDAGLAHRDIKPANLMVRAGTLLVIDVFFVQVRPSPWRQAVDLANMMLVLAVRSDPERVYRQALRYFTPREMAEAFAATKGVASPTQLKDFMKKDGRDLLKQFRQMAPEHPPIRYQRFSVRRFALTVGVLGAASLATLGGISTFIPTQNVGVAVAPECGSNHAAILSAQAVPSASFVPCIDSLPSGWTFGGAQIQSGLARFWLDSDRAGAHALEVTLLPSCSVAGMVEGPSDQSETSSFERPSRLRPGLSDLRTYKFAGGCTTYRFAFATGPLSALVFDVNTALSFYPRSELVRYVSGTEELSLCGRSVRCP
jgi:tRNA A-37 threonylcarbamoyl transferase component Bud32